MANIEHEPSSSVAPEAAPQRRRHRSGSKSSRVLRRVRRRFRKTRWGTVTLVAVAVVAVLIVGSLALAADSGNRVSSSISSLERVVKTLNSKSRTDLTLTDFTRLETSVNDLAGSLQTAQRQLGIFRPVSGMNAQLAATLIEIDTSLELAKAAQEMLSGLQPTLFFLVSGEEDQAVAQISSGERVVELLQIGRGSFVRATQHLSNARAAINRLNLDELTPDHILTASQLDTYYEQLVQANTLLIDAPDLLTAAMGLGGEQSYLILSQNSDELRPSGGYISTFGWMTVRNGRVTGHSYSPTTTTSPNPPSASLAEGIDVPDWWIRYSQPVYAAWDGSWYADFPSTAEMSMWYYNNGHNPQSPVDGVIAIDIIGFEKLLAALQTVVVPGYDDVVTAENFREMIYNIRESGAGDTPHKQFLAALYQQIFHQWQSAGDDPQTSSRLLGEVLEALQQKHIMFYFADDNMNQAMKLLGWSGEQEPARDHDYLMVADSNLGNKSNRSILRQWFYDVDVQTDGSLISRTTIAYDYSDRIASADPAVDPAHHGPLDYNNLLQVYVPVGSRMITVGDLPRDPTRVETEEHTILVSRMNLPYDSSARPQLTYETPRLVESIGPYQRYRLLLQKQPGTLGDAVNVQVSLPAGATAIGITPEPAASYDLDQPILEFRLTLENDQWIEVVYQQP